VPTSLSFIAILLSALVIASDLLLRRVLNPWLLAALIFGAGVTFTSWLQGTSGPPWPALLGLLIGLVAFLPFHIFGWMGAGDVKFFSVLGFLLGAKALLPIWVIGSLIAGVNALTVLMSRHWLVNTVPGWGPARTWFSVSAFGQRLATARKGRQGLPYAAWLGVGALITVFNPELMQW
jgi:prepilin peptidase CpaA